MRPINWIRAMSRLDEMFWVAEDAGEDGLGRELRPMLGVINEELRHADRLYLTQEEWDAQMRDHAAGDGIDVDADAVVSHGDEDGAYVQAWVWVDNGAVRQTIQAARNRKIHNARVRS